MKVLINVPDLNLPGGVANYYKNLRLNDLENIDYFIINGKEKNLIVSLLKKYYTFWKQMNNYDIIHLNPSLDFKSYYRDMIFLLLAKIRKKQIIVFWRGWNNNFEKKTFSNTLQRYIFKKTYGSIQHCIVLGDIFKQKIKQIGINDHILFHIETTLANDKYLDVSVIDKKLYNKEVESIQILFISRILKEKGVYIAIDTFSAVQKNIAKPMKLIIAGDGDELENVKRYIDSSSIKNVVLTGNIQNEVKHNTLLKSDILLFPTYFGEGLPNSILEAMLYGMPIISTINAGIPDQVENGKNGFLLQSKNYEDYIPYLTQLVDNSSLMKSIGRNNFEKAKNLYTREKIKMRLLKIYDN